MTAHEGGFFGALRLVCFASAVAVAFIALPGSFEATWPVVQHYVLSGYGAGVLEWAPLFWKIVLALLLYGVTRAVLYFLVSAGGLLVALRLFWRRGRE